MTAPRLPARLAWRNDTGDDDDTTLRRGLLPRPHAPQANERGWVPWTAPERESFFDAITRHRGASWRITFVCAFAIAVLALVVAVLLSPLLICLIGLAVDLGNLIVPLPDVLGGFGRWIDTLFTEETFCFALLAKVVAVAAIPASR